MRRLSPVAFIFEPPVRDQFGVTPPKGTSAPVRFQAPMRGTLVPIIPACTYPNPVKPKD